MLADDLADAHPLAGTQDGIDASNGLDQVAVAFGHTTGGDKLLPGVLFGTHFVQDGNGLVTGRRNKATCVDDDHIGLLGFGDGRMPLCL